MHSQFLKTNKNKQKRKTKTINKKKTEKKQTAKGKGEKKTQPQQQQKLEWGKNTIEKHTTIVNPVKKKDSPRRNTLTHSTIYPPPQKTQQINTQQ